MVCFPLQETPIGHPSLVKPNLDKIDLQRLKGDVKKYEVSGALSRDACAYWKSFLGNFYKNRE